MSPAAALRPAMPLAVRRSRRRWRALALLLACGWIADRYALPALARRGVRQTLASSGYPDARFEIDRLGIDRMRLRGVQLAAGVDLGEIDLDVGISALWGRRPTTATIRGARVALEAVRPMPAARSGPAAIERVRVEGAELTRGRDRATISGELALAGPFTADLRATGLRVGGVAVDAAALRVREADGGYGAAWELRGAGFAARGEATLARTAGKLQLVRGHAELRADGLRAGAIALDGAEVALDASGPLGDLELRGAARADRVEIAADAADGADGATLRLRDVRAPIAVRARAGGGALAVIGRALAASAAEATLAAAGREVRVTGLELEVGGGAGGGADDSAANDRTLLTLGGEAAWPADLRWRAASARSGALVVERLAGSYTAATGAHAIAWRSLAVGERTTGAGSVALRQGGGQIELERAHLAVAGGELTAGPAILVLPGAAPAAPAAPLVITARGLSLDRLLPGHAVAATAVLDGELALRLDGGDPTLVRGELHARGRGAIRIVDPALRARVSAMAGLEHRVVGALADFEHTQLAAVLGPRGSEPELRVIVRGHGASVPQELDLALNVRGAWTALDRLARNTP